MKKHKHIRKLQKDGTHSYTINIPKDLVKELKWKERQKFIVKKIHGGVVIKDWKK